MSYVTYFRVSTRQQGESGLGLQSQRAILSHYLDADDLIAEFTEVASGKSIDGRPELQKAVAMCAQGGHTLAVAKLDRLSRRTEDALYIWGRLDGRLYTCDIPQDNGRMDKFTLTIFMALADRERELISIRTKAALAQSKKKLGNPDHLTPEAQLKGAAANRQDAQDAYRKQLNYITHMRSDGMTLRAIATQLNDDGYTTRRDKQFTGATVHRILSRRENP